MKEHGKKSEHNTLARNEKGSIVILPAPQLVSVKPKQSLFTVPQLVGSTDSTVALARDSQPGMSDAFAVNASANSLLNNNSLIFASTSFDALAMHFFDLHPSC